MDQVYQILDEVSNPKSEKYGKHLSFEEIGELTSDSKAKSLVLSHLLKYVNAREVVWSEFTSFISVKTDIRTAEKILGAKYNKFHSETTGEEIVRTFEFVLPKEVREVLDYVSPTVQFATRRPGPIVMDDFSNNDNVTKGKVTPQVLFDYYNITSNTVTNSRATQGVYEYNESFWPKDLKKFQKKFNLPEDKVDQIVGQNNKTLCQDKPGKCMESTLDLQYIMSVAQYADTTYWNEDVPSLLTWIESVASSPTSALIQSVSWGGNEHPKNYQEEIRFSEEAAKLGTRGITILIASGDDGVASSKARKGSQYCGFVPDYPANSPYVLAVGATMGPETGTKPEIACQSSQGAIITSGGGFSNIFPTPSYQKSAVQKYLSNSAVTSNSLFPPNTMYNASGRGYPDVSLAGNLFVVIVNQTKIKLSGTSASTPSFAGLLTLANDARLNKGKSPLGFVNPALYQLFETDPTIFNDITSGANQCTAKVHHDEKEICCEYGFVCSTGWDPVTGLGSVNAGRLIEALTNL